MTTRIGAIDIGTNSVLLLIAEPDGEGRLRRVVDRATITRLGQGVDATGQLAPQAVARTLACIDDYAEELRAHEVDRIGAVGTSAMRDARGGEAFMAAFAERVGVRPEVISGEREAALTFDGAITGLSPEQLELEADGRVAVFDVGGGSTEVIVGRRGAEGVTIDQAVSLDVGAVRLTERHAHHDPPTALELAAIRDDVRRLASDAPTLTGLPLVGVAGTVTTIAAVVRGDRSYDAESVHGLRLSSEQLADCLAQLSSCDLERRREIPGLDPARADVIIAGGCIVDEIRALAEVNTLTVSDRGVRWGLAREIATRPRAPGFLHATR